MKKKQGNLLSWGITIFAAACGVVAFFMIFFDAVKFNGLIFGSSFTGLQVALGYTVDNVKVFEASAGIILAYLFPLVGACAAIIGKGNKFVSFLSAVLMLVGGILAFCTISLLNGSFIGSPSLAVGSIVSGVLAIVGGVVECGSILLKK